MKQETKKTTTKKTQEAKVMKDTKKKGTKKEEVKVEAPVVETEQETVVETAKEEPVKANKEKKAKVVGVKQMTNSEFAQLFRDNGCVAQSGAKDTSNVVYNQFGTKSRILQQTRAYQLLLTNGHIKKKDEVLDVEYNDTERFKLWYATLDDTKKAGVSGYEGIDAGRLSDSEFPREKTVKITNFDLLVEYIKYMATFDENKLVVA